jgi:hypothetical protein
VGFAVGSAEGAAVGFAVGAVVGLAVGVVVGFAVGAAVGFGVAVGFAVAVGDAVGFAVAVGLGVAVGFGVVVGFGVDGTRLGKSADQSMSTAARAYRLVSLGKERDGHEMSSYDFVSLSSVAGTESTSLIVPPFFTSAEIAVSAVSTDERSEPLSIRVK